MLNHDPAIPANPSYDADACLAEFYDRTETQTRDVELLRKLLADRGPLCILEPFCGTGRILLPLLTDGHELVGMDASPRMLDRARMKVAALPLEVERRARLIHADCTKGPWPDGFDIVLLAGNCLYELESAEQQRSCIGFAAAALKSGGRLYLDNDHMEGDLAESWCRIGIEQPAYPIGDLPDSTRLSGSSCVLWVDRPNRLWRTQRTLTIRFPDGQEIRREWVQQKHPPSIDEMRTWLDEAGFAIEQSRGSHDGAPLSESSPRAFFWARRR